MIFTLINVVLAIIINLIVIYFIESFDKNSRLITKLNSNESNYTINKTKKSFQVESCICNNNDDFKPLFIKYYSKITIVLLVLIYLVPLFLKLIRLIGLATTIGKTIKSPIGSFLLSIFIAVGFFNIFFLFRYTKEKESDLCNCKTELQEIIRQALMYYSMVIMLTYIVTTLVTFTLRK